MEEEIGTKIGKRIFFTLESGSHIKVNRSGNDVGASVSLLSINQAELGIAVSRIKAKGISVGDTLQISALNSLKQLRHLNELQLRVNRISDDDRYIRISLNCHILNISSSEKAKIQKEIDDLYRNLNY